jgi:hypothetical protein
MYSCKVILCGDRYKLILSLSHGITANAFILMVRSTGTFVPQFMYAKNRFTVLYFVLKVLPHFLPGKKKCSDYPKACRLALKPTQPPIQSVLGVLFFLGGGGKMDED